jgi:hypothetical protein
MAKRSKKRQQRNAVRPAASPQGNSGGGDWYAVRMIATILQVILGLFLLPAAVGWTGSRFGGLAGALVGILFIPLWRVIGDFLNPDETRTRTFSAFLIYCVMVLVLLLFLPCALLLFLFDVVRPAVLQITGVVALLVTARATLGRPDGEVLAWEQLALAWGLVAVGWLLRRYVPPLDRGARLATIARWYNTRMSALDRAAEQTGEAEQKPGQ